MESYSLTVPQLRLQDLLALGRQQNFYLAGLYGILLHSLTCLWNLTAWPMKIFLAADKTFMKPFPMLLLHCLYETWCLLCYKNIFGWLCLAWKKKFDDWETAGKIDIFLCTNYYLNVFNILTLTVWVVLIPADNKG